MGEEAGVFEFVPDSSITKNLLIFSRVLKLMCWIQKWASVRMLVPLISHKW